MVSGVHSLVTGLNGHGKTLYAVSEKLRPLIGKKLKYTNHEGLEVEVERRLMIGGIKDLLIPHQIIDVPRIDPEQWRDDWAGERREPGQPALDVPHLATNWWCWCEPGDVIVIDECQRLFRPMASGRKVPMFIEKLETARHYGVQFVYITQHPQLIHTNLRSLVGPHEHVRRMFGSSTTMIYQWDHCTHPDKIKTATRKAWRHSKAAFGLYKSAEVHTKFSQRVPFAVFALVGALVSLVVLGFFLKDRMAKRFGEQPDSALVQADAKKADGGRPARAADGKTAATSSGPAWPVLNAAVPVVHREPFHDRGLTLDGWYQVGQSVSYQFGLTVDGRRVATLTGANLLAAGYAIRQLAPCAVVLVFGEVERSVTCAPAAASPAPSSASAPAA
jgi:zona occludens toxin